MALISFALPYKEHIRTSAAKLARIAFDGAKLRIKYKTTKKMLEKFGERYKHSQKMHETMIFTQLSEVMKPHP